ncbi:MAG: transporter substrate-binding protein [Rariglobus sp.]|jgi:raffinose/stachyose/melibiose transport system substrate-binding protein|nr:transporter substrate-binding protein [Rariglobus sp.]
MNRERLSLIAGLTLLAVVFASASLNIWKRSSNEAKPGQKIIRLAHWQLEPPVRAAFEKIAAIYMEEHPGVTIETIAVPERTYAQWFMTRLVGGFAPDLIEIRSNGDSALISRYFTPLTEAIEKPNPYNAGTPLADASWRNTFIDGLANDQAYHPQLLDYYAVPVSQFTNRIIYNQALWREVLGDTPHPATYAELIALCTRFSEEARKKGRAVVPFLSSKYHASGVYNRLFSSQTQKLTEQLRGTPLFIYNTVELQLDYIRGDWSLDTPEIVSGLNITRDVSTLFQSGYEQLSREDGGFRFLQGTALMIYTGSWDYASFRDQAQFKLGVFDLPIPEAGSAGFGQYVAGEPSEGGVATNAVFSLARQSQYPAEALDFLQFLTSERGNRLFAEASGWLPAIVGVKPDKDIQPFYPEIEGVRNGFDTSTLGQQNAGRVVESGRHALLGPNGSVEAYRTYLKQELGPAVREDLERIVVQQNKVVQRQDSVIAAYAQLARNPEHAAGALRKMRENEESQTTLETLTAWISLNLDEPVR